MIHIRPIGVEKIFEILLAYICINYAYIRLTKVWNNAKIQNASPPSIMIRSPPFFVWRISSIVPLKIADRISIAFLVSEKIYFFSKNRQKMKIFRTIIWIFFHLEELSKFCQLIWYYYYSRLQKHQQTWCSSNFLGGDTF